MPGFRYYFEPDQIDAIVAVHQDHPAASRGSGGPLTAPRESRARFFSPRSSRQRDARTRRPAMRRRRTCHDDPARRAVGCRLVGDRADPDGGARGRRRARPARSSRPPARRSAASRCRRGPTAPTSSPRCSPTRAATTISRRWRPANIKVWAQADHLRHWPRRHRSRRRHSGRTSPSSRSRTSCANCRATRSSRRCPTRRRKTPT